MMARVDEIHEELGETLREVALWEGLIESAGFQKLKADMELQRTSRLLLVGETPLNSISGVFPQEFMKGEGAGIGLAMIYPYTQLEIARDTVARLRVELEQEQEHVTQENASTDGGSRVDDKQWFGQHN